MSPATDGLDPIAAGTDDTRTRVAIERLLPPFAGPRLDGTE
ncbi:hypothetical protein [Haloarcula mannanilytica]|nr:hypothetical protein [Haloarcula mannanilytica]